MSKFQIVCVTALVFLVVGAAFSHMPAIMAGVMIAVVGGVSSLRRFRRT